MPRRRSTLGFAANMTIFASGLTDDVAGVVAGKLSGFGSGTLTEVQVLLGDTFHAGSGVDSILARGSDDDAVVAQIRMLWTTALATIG